MHIAVSVITPEVRGEAPLALFKGDFSTRLSKAAACGYEGIELVTTDPASLDAADIRRSLQANGLQAAAVATGYISASRGLTLTSPDPEICAAARALLEDLIRFAAAVGSPIVTIGSFRGMSANAGASAVWLSEALASVDALAASLNVRLALEAIRPQDTDLLNNGAQICALLDAGSYTSAGLLLDSYHVFGNEPGEAEAFRLYKDRLIHVHLADTGRKPLGRGSYDFAAMEAVLRDIGYTGWQSLELARGDDPDGNARVSMEYLKGL